MCAVSPQVVQMFALISQATALLSKMGSSRTLFRRRVTIALSYSALHALSLSTNSKAEIALHRIYALNEGLQPIVRLNTFSDLLWEKIAPELFTEFSSIKFYDYTKYPLRYRKNLPDNYHLTFSRAETSDNQAEAQKYLDANKPISVVFDTKKGEDLPETFLGHTVVDADIHDAKGKAKTDTTFPTCTKKGLVLGLRAKGKAKNDTSGFVVRTNQWSL
jgi:hypothetical protein